MKIQPGDFEVKTIKIRGGNIPGNFLVLIGLNLKFGMKKTNSIGIKIIQIDFLFVNNKIYVFK